MVKRNGACSIVVAQVDARRDVPEANRHLQWIKGNQTPALGVFVDENRPYKDGLSKAERRTVAVRDGAVDYRGFYH
jgi:hypothetical protein